MILAGGGNRRYGAPKAFAMVGGRPIIDRVLAALQGAGLRAVIVANDLERYGGLGVPVRPDAGSVRGPLGGICTALLWAREEGAPGAVVLACDMPFVTSPLVRRLLAEADGAEAVLPESGGPRGVEPLCAYYSVRCLPAIEAALERRALAAVAFLDQVRVRKIPAAEVERLGPAGTPFLNVNSRADLERAERIAAAPPDPGSPEPQRGSP